MTGTITINSGWVKDFDQDTFEIILMRMEQWKNQENNTCDQEEINQFISGDYLVEYNFDDEEIGITAGRHRQDLNNQNTWFSYPIRPFNLN